MLNNCSSGRTPWNSYLTCEETMDNYLDPAQPETNYGWVVEIDPLRELAQPTKRTAMGRFNHENVAYMRTEEHTSELQSLMRISYAVFCWQKKTQNIQQNVSIISQLTKQNNRENHT